MTNLKETFLKEVRSHKLEVIRYVGAYRHFRLSDGTKNLQYDLVTWPGNLCYCGDMGSYLFKAEGEIFNLFRNEELKTKPSYWEEKVIAFCPVGTKEYSNDRFREVIAYAAEQDGMEHVQQLIKEEVLDPDCDSEDLARQAVQDFNEEHGEYFMNFGEADLTDFTYQYQWACFAIVWGIQQYDLAHKS